MLKLIEIKYYRKRYFFRLLLYRIGLKSPFSVFFYTKYVSIIRLSRTIELRCFHLQPTKYTEKKLRERGVTLIV